MKNLQKKRKCNGKIKEKNELYLVILDQPKTFGVGVFLSNILGSILAWFRRA